MENGSLRLLLVEDNPGDALLLRETLAEVEAPHVDWVHEVTLGDALKRLGRERFDAILLDLTLPDSTGLATFTRLHERAPSAPVLMMTGLADEQMAAQAMQAGAQDYLVKGRVGGEGLLRAIRFAVERGRRERAETALRQAEGEFQAARLIQQRLYPHHPPQVPGFDIAGASYPAVATGGDYFDIFPINQSCMALAVGDVSSHGIGPALLMAETRAYLRAFSVSCPRLEQILTQVNRAIAGDTADEQFITLLLACLDPQARSLRHVSAGHHPPGFVLAPDGQVRRLDSTGFPLGIVPEAEFESAEPIELQPGQIVLLPTDGIPEALSPSDEAFGMDRMLDVVRRNGDRPAREIVDALYCSVRAHIGATAQMDDLTAVVVKVL